MNACLQFLGSGFDPHWILARRRSSHPEQRVYWSVIDWLDWQLLDKASCVMGYARGQKRQTFRQESDFCIIYSVVPVSVRPLVDLEVKMQDNVLSGNIASQ